VVTSLTSRFELPRVAAAITTVSAAIAVLAAAPVSRARAQRVLTVVAHDTSLESSPTVPAGITTIRLVLKGKVKRELVVHRVPASTTPEDLARGAAGRLERWFHDWSFGGPSVPHDSASEASATLDLRPGRYLLVAYEVFWKNYKDRGELPSVNMVVPFLALYVWWLPITRQYEFYFLLTPFFHSLQYLAFVYKMEDTRLRGLNHPEIRGTILAFAIVLAGWLAFEFVPNEVDTVLGTFNAWQMFFFFTAAMLFINIHHYFIDNVLWRFKDPEIQKYLLG